MSVDFGAGVVFVGAETLVAVDWDFGVDVVVVALPNRLPPPAGTGVPPKEKAGAAADVVPPKENPEVTEGAGAGVAAPKIPPPAAGVGVGVVEPKIPPPAGAGAGVEPNNDPPGVGAGFPNILPPGFGAAPLEPSVAADMKDWISAGLLGRNPDHKTLGQ